METVTPGSLYLEDTPFQNLMQKRIFNVLLIASDYDAFMLEEDGRLEEQLFYEYTSLNLSSPPRVTRVSNVDEALRQLTLQTFDVIFLMPGTDIGRAFEEAKLIKRQYPHIPLIALTPFSREVTRRIDREDATAIDFVFSWLGNVDLLLAIIKMLEDRMNADNDVNQVGVQVILLVEDSIRFYSSVLPTLYKYLLKQSQAFATEALNEHEQMLRMRGRPKVMLARNYEEAIELYDKFRENILGVISDVSFKRGGEKDSLAGIKLAKEIREQDPFLPVIIESSQTENAERVKDFDGIFIDKNSRKHSVDLGEAITSNFGFGDFIVVNPADGVEVMRISSLKDLQHKLYEIPDESLFYHAAKNDISRWLYSRAMFPIAKVLKKIRFKNLSQTSKAREVISNAIIKYRRMKNRGVVAVFNRNRFDRYSNFARIGQGSLGGKARGLAFIDSIIKKKIENDTFQGVSVCIPRTVVLCTDIFDEFMTRNKLYRIALSNASDSEILHHFLKAELPKTLIKDFLSLFDVFDRPLAIRSSSLLEDSHYQPFAGVYSTYMIPRKSDKREMLQLLSQAIKGVYASVFYKASKLYMNATRNVIDQEKMAVIIQEVVGEYHDDIYFPSFSGVARSLNYYPIGKETTDDGISQVAVGLGKYIVDGGEALRFCPRHPRSVLQTSTLDLALKSTQTSFDALSNANLSREFTTDDAFNIVRRNINDFAGKPVLNYMVSTYNAADDMIVDNNVGRGRRVVTFANILRDDVFPLAPVVEFMLNVGQQAMGRPVEIEYAGMINSSISGDADKGQIYWLQIRPIVEPKNVIKESLLKLPVNDLILRTNTALGNGNIDNVCSILYVRPESFDNLRTEEIAAQISKINGKMIESSRNYVLIGPGRWGTSDHALGIPVKWTDISNAAVIVESALDNFNIEPSQGTHFFQNLTSFGVGYLTVNPKSGTDFYDIGFLDSQPAETETEFLRLVNFDAPLEIGIDGRKSIGIIVKPSVKT